MNGKNMINSDIDARTAACRQMGQRLFYQQMLSDSLQGADGRASDEIDVVTLKDYMQYTSLLDELPSYLGGRANNWRRLTLEDIPRHSIFYDIVSYIESGHITADLRERLPMLLTQPNAHSVQLQHIELLRHVRSSEISRASRTPTAFHKQHLSTGRRSRRALENASKMRRAYIMTRSESLPTTLILQYEQQVAAPNATEDEEPRRRPDNTPIAKDEFTDGEVDALYAWTEQLEWNEDLFKADRISTG